jgi:putative membrane protein
LELPPSWRWPRRFAVQAQPAKINDAQIAHIAYTAGVLDVTAGKQALAKSHDKAVRDFAAEMVRDHTAVNDQALALVKKLGGDAAGQPHQPGACPRTRGQAEDPRRAERRGLRQGLYRQRDRLPQDGQRGARNTLIPNAQNAELKGLLQTGLKLFTEHQTHAEHLANGQR